ncbi:hypothetical protein OAG71_02520 [bacterium]|nr:hypothetical protein [bacterium]
MHQFTINRLKGADPHFEKIVIEIRYADGYSYLDKCGKLISTILEQNDEWSVDPNDPNPQSANLYSFANGASLGINTKRIGLVLETPSGNKSLKFDDIEGFKEQIDSVVKLTLTLLGVEKLTRIGVRLWYLFPFDNQQTREMWIDSLGIVKVAPEFVEALNGELDGGSFALGVKSEDNLSYRISLNSAERNSHLEVGNRTINIASSKLSEGQAKKLRKLHEKRMKSVNEDKFPAMIDIDVFKETVTTDDIDVIFEKALESYTLLSKFSNTQG